MSATQLDAFNAESPGELTGPRLEKSGPALWSAEKSALIDEYIHLFLLVTKQGRAIQAKYFTIDSPTALAFVDWYRRVFP